MRGAMMMILVAAAPLWSATCTVTNGGLVFGLYNPINGTNTDSTGTISVTCVTLVSTFLTYNVHLGMGGAGSYSPRLLAGGLGTLAYNIYLDGGRAIVWGNGTGGTSTQSFAATIPVGATVNVYTAYGRIPASQTARAGAYLDSVLITVNY